MGENGFGEARPITWTDDPKGVANNIHCYVDRIRIRCLGAVIEILTDCPELTKIEWAHFLAGKPAGPEFILEHSEEI